MSNMQLPQAQPLLPPQGSPSQQEQTAKQAGSDLASLRQELRNVMDWGRWSWFTKLPEATRPTRLPSLLQDWGVEMTMTLLWRSER
jgi:hypothetical protein